MTLQKANRSWIIWATLFMAYVLCLLPMPSWLAIGRPEWLAMVVIYWGMALPERIGIITAWTLGILLDVMQGVLLGQNALGMVVVAYVALRLHRRIRVFPLLQQSLFILVLVGIYQLISLWARSVVGRMPPNLLFLMPAVVSAVLWPWLFIILRDIRRRYKVS
ncbi:rod shape-determining protein MreD [Zooshikella harenae]|uniref:Rod shape-determining protein MreD n=1 Tax=Zooshikella harenae TaxID=2827238 RepID=A0ABS5Z7R0_9GAMM|nr:rod shape-determining protein MreD [Zooshikella harenae]MBU2710089.1 rod shape-determining protein MreD [Zooshikella harenae]